MLPTQGAGRAQETRIVQSRIPKMLAHCVLSTAPYMIYIDGKLAVSEPIQMWGAVRAFDARRAASRATR